MAADQTAFRQQTLGLSGKTFPDNVNELEYKSDVTILKVNYVAGGTCFDC